jgi:hypothetical protein
MVSHDLAVFCWQLAQSHPEVRVPQCYVDAARDVQRRQLEKQATFRAQGYERLDVSADLTKLPCIGEAINV